MGDDRAAVILALGLVLIVTNGVLAWRHRRDRDGEVYVFVLLVVVALIVSQLAGC